MSKFLSRRSITSFGVGLCAVFSGNAHAVCSSLVGTSQGTDISSLVAQGSSDVVVAITRGFDGVQAALAESGGKQSTQIVTALEGFTQAVIAELRQIPKTQAEIDRRRNEVDPTRQMTDPCGQVAIAADVRQSDNVSSDQAQALMRGAIQYNASGVSSRLGSSENMFTQAVGRNLRDRPGISESPVVFASGKPLSSGAMTEDELQDAAFMTYVTTNPLPPAQERNPVSVADMNANVEASLYNMRMTIPQSVQSQLLAYETPVLEVNSGSSYWKTLQAMGVAPEDGGATIQLSKRQRMEVDATKRLKDPSYIAMLSAKDTQGSLKDLAMTKADLLAQEFEGWKQDRNTVLLLSQLLAAKLRSE